jgi:hypothetical protein
LIRSRCSLFLVAETSTSTKTEVNMKMAEYEKLRAEAKMLTEKLRVADFVVHWSPYFVLGIGAASMLIPDWIWKASISSNEG